MIKNLKIWHKFLFLFLLMTILVGTMGYIGIRAIKQVNTSFGEIVEINTPAIQALLEIKSTANKIEAKTVGFQLLETDSARSEGTRIGDKKFELLAEIEHIKKWEQKYVDSLLSQFSDQDITVQNNMVQNLRRYNGYKRQRAEILQNCLYNIENIGRYRQQVVAIALDIINLKEQKATKQQLQPKIDSLETAESELQKIIKGAIDHDVSMLNQKKKSAISTAQSLVFWNTILIFGSIGIIFVIGFFFAKSIVQPVLTIRNRVQNVAEGEFDQRVHISNTDEIGQLAHEFNKMAEKLQSSHSEIQTQRAKMAHGVWETQKQNKKLEDTKKVMISIMEDVEIERKKMELAKQKTDAILENIGEGVIATNHIGNILFANSAAAKMMKVDKDEIVGHSVLNVIPIVNDAGEPIASTDHPITKVLSEGLTISVNISSDEKYNFIGNDNSRFPVALNATPMILDFEKKQLGMIMVFHDITKEKQIDKAKSEFVSLASHQLRTPLTAMNWFAKILKKGKGDDAVSEKQIKYLDKILEGGARMSRLVNGLLNTSRIDLGTLAIDPEPTDLSEQADSIVDELVPDITKKQMEIIKEYDPKVPKLNADPKLMRIIFQNLLSNAVKYTPEKGKIFIGIKLKGSLGIGITIEDTGFGIPEKDQSKMFTKLFRAENAKESQIEGTGLGLYIVKSIVEEAGGEIRFKSVEGKGTKFMITLPLKGMKKREGVSPS